MGETYNGSLQEGEKCLISLIDSLEKNAEINMRHYLRESLATLLREEEIKWYRCAKVTTLLGGDNNIKIFHLVEMASIANNITNYRVRP